MLFDWSMAEFVEKLSRRRAAAGGLSRPGRDRHQRQPLRQGHRLHPLSSRLGPAGRNAGHVGLRARRHGHGLVLLLRCGARGRSHGGLGGSRGARSFPAKACGWKAASGSARGPSSPMPTHARLCACWAPPPIPPGERVSRRFPSKAAPSSSTCTCASCPTSPRVPAHRVRGRAASLRPDQRAAHERRVEGRLRRRAPRRVARASVVRALLPERARRVCCPRPAPHTMSVFAQYVPYTFAQGDWDTAPRRSAQAGARFPRPLLLEYRHRR